jgi:aldose 1-epimerase
MEYVLVNRHGNRVTLSSMGAAITSIIVPDAQGTPAEITVAAGFSAGKTIGRYANRIARGEFTLDGVTYRLPVNEGRNTLHGGPDGFSHREWEAASRDETSVEFLLFSPDGDQGFPGAMECRIRYTWDDANELALHYTATADKPTVLNLTNHVYFNLRGPDSHDIADQELQIDASAYTPLDDELIPTGEIAPVDGTTRDFRVMRPITSEKYDCNFVLDGWNGELRYAAEARDPLSGRRVIVRTTQPGFQFYTGKPGAFAMETQHFADAPHHANFPTTVLRPGQTFVSTTTYRFFL